MHFGAPEVPDENRMKSGWSNANCTNSIAVGSSRATKGSLGAADGSRGMIDAIHHAAHRGRTRSLEAARDLLHARDRPVAGRQALHHLPSAQRLVAIGRQDDVMPLLGQAGNRPLEEPQIRVMRRDEQDLP